MWVGRAEERPEWAVCVTEHKSLALPAALHGWSCHGHRYQLPFNFDPFGRWLGFFLRGVESLR